MHIHLDNLSTIHTLETQAIFVYALDSDAISLSMYQKIFFRIYDDTMFYIFFFFDWSMPHEQVITIPLSFRFLFYFIWIKKIMQLCWSDSFCENIVNTSKATNGIRTIGNRWKTICSRSEYFGCRFVQGKQTSRNVWECKSKAFLAWI